MNKFNFKDEAHLDRNNKEMRPIDVTRLVEDEGLNSKDSTDRPQFLNIKTRKKLAEDKLNSTCRISKKRITNNRQEIFHDHESTEMTEFSNKRRGLIKNKNGISFDWKVEDDTFANYKPISSVRAKDLLRKDSEIDVFEKSYMDNNWRNKKLSEMTPRYWRILYENYGIKTKGGRIAHPMRYWNEGNLIPDEILDVIENKLGFKEPTAIQRITIPNIQENRDFIGVASTGSGKTLAFLITIFMKLVKNHVSSVLTKLDGPYALILAPTRELAQQIETEAKKLALHIRRPWLITSIVGGHSIEEITFNLQHGCDILVATPGRLIDCLEHHVLVLRQIQTLVLDEADRMVDYGFEEQLTNILSRIDNIANRQTLMFTATMSATIENIANKYLNDPAYATVGDTDDSPKIQQILDYIPNKENRFKKLYTEILPKFAAATIIFINYKSTADWLSTKFQSDKRFRITILHGSKSQTQREHSIRQLREGKLDIMIATNVAARGIDIPNVSLVVNFEMATNLDDYIHRIGRTGRANQYGTAITFLGPDDEPDLVEKLCKYVRDSDVTKSNYIDTDAIKKFKIDDKNKDAIIY